MEGYYRNQRHLTPSPSEKWISEYDIDGREIQFLQQGNPDVIFTKDLDLSVAQTVGDPLIIPIVGRGVVIMGYSLASKYNPTANTGTEVAEPSAFVSCRVNGNDPSKAYPLKHNRGFRGSFNQLFLSWPAQTNVGAKLIIFKADLMPYHNSESDNRFNSVEASNVSTPSAVTINTTASAIVAASVARKCATIQNLGSVDLYVGDSTISATKGTKLIPGAILFWKNTAALYGITGSSSVSVGINEEY